MAGVIDAKSGDRVGITVALDDQDSPVYVAVFDCDQDSGAVAALSAEEATEVCRAIADAVLAISEPA